MRDYSNYYPTYEEVILKNGEGIFEQQLAGFEGMAVEIDGVEGRALVQYHQNPLNEFRQDRRISVSSAVNLNRGSYVKTIEDDRLFLTLSEVNQNQLVKYALIREVNTTLNFINSSDKLTSKPAITSAQTLYTTGIKDENVLRVPDGMQGIQLPYDDETKKLSRGDCFVFNKTKYEITFYDRTTHPGLLVLICKETSISDVFDDLENEIADRYRTDGSDRLTESSPIEPEIPEEPVDPTEPPSEDSLTIQIVGADRFGLMTESTYIVKVLNNGVEVDGEVKFSVNNTLANIKSQLNNSCVVETNRQFKTGAFTLRAELLNDNLIFDEKNIIITGL